MANELTYYLENLKRNVDIAEVARRLDLKVVGAGAKHSMVRCPFHDDRTPSMALYKDRGWFHCFGCGEQGDMIDLVKRLRGVDFRDAVAWLGGSLPENRTASLPTQIRKAPAKPSLRRALELALDRYNRVADGERLNIWARQRALPVAVLQAAGAVAVGSGPLASQLDDLDREQEDILLEAGLLRRSTRNVDRLSDTSSGRLPLMERPYDHFRDRILFPLRDLEGTLVGFAGRYIGQARTPPPPKYLSSSGFLRSKTLYRADRVRHELQETATAAVQPLARTVFVVEGLVDALRLESLGFLAVAALGSSITEDQVEVLVALAEVAGGRIDIHLVLDADEAGRKGTRRALHALLDRSADPEARLRVDAIDISACVPKGTRVAKDPDELLKGIRPNDAGELLQRGLVSPAQALLADHLDATPASLPEAWEKADHALRHQACAALIRSIRRHAHWDQWGSSAGAPYRNWWAEQERTGQFEWADILATQLLSKGATQAIQRPAPRAALDDKVLLMRAMRLGEASAHRREVPFDRGSWDRIGRTPDGFLHPLAVHLRHLDRERNSFAPLDLYCATLTPKNAEESRLKAMPGPEDLVLQQYMLLHLLGNPEDSGFERLIPAVRYQVTRSDGPRVWTTGRRGGAERVVSFAYQVDMDVLSGNRVPQTSGVFRHWFECWQSYRQEIQRQLRRMSGPVYAMSLDVRRFYDSVRWTDIRNTLLGPLRDAVETLREPHASFAPLFRGNERTRVMPANEVAGDVVDWFRDQASAYAYHSPKDGTTERTGASGIGLAQGPDLSAYLANIVLFPMDARLVEVLDELREGGGGGLYARYVDDMVIASTNRDDLLRLRDIIESELSRLGLRLKPDKSQVIWGQTPAEVAWLLDRDFVPSGAAGEMPPVDGADAWADDGPAVTRRDALQILTNPALDELTEKARIEAQLKRAAQAGELRHGDYARLAALVWALACPPRDGVGATSVDTIAGEYFTAWKRIVDGTRWAQEVASSDPAWTLRHYLAWLEGIDHALEGRRDLSPRLPSEASAEVDRRQRELAWAVNSGLMDELWELQSIDRADTFRQAREQLDHSIWLRWASIATSAQAVLTRPTGNGQADDNPVKVPKWPTWRERESSAIRRYRTTFAEQTGQFGPISDAGHLGSTAVQFGNHAGCESVQTALWLHEAVARIMARQTADAADPIEPLRLAVSTPLKSTAPEFACQVRGLLETWLPQNGGYKDSDDSPPAEPWQLAAFVSCIRGEDFLLLERRPRLWASALSWGNAGGRPQLVPSPPGADVRALLGLADDARSPSKVVAVEYFGREQASDPQRPPPEDLEARFRKTRPQEINWKKVAPESGALNDYLQVLQSALPPQHRLLDADELRKRLHGDPDLQIAWLARSFGVLADSLTTESEDGFVDIPTSANLLMVQEPPAGERFALTGRVLGYRVSAAQVAGSAYVHGGHGGLEPVGVPEGMDRYWRIGLALADALGELHGLTDGGLEKLRVPSRHACAGSSPEGWAARTMLRLCLVRLTGRGQVRRGPPPSTGALPTTIQRTLEHMASWPSARDPTGNGLRARVAHVLSLHVAVAAATHRSQGDPPGPDLHGGSALFLADVGQLSVPFDQGLIQLLCQSFPVEPLRHGNPLRQPTLAWWGIAARLGAAARALGDGEPIGQVAPSSKVSLHLELDLAAGGLRILAIAAMMRAMVLERLGLLDDRHELWQRLRREETRVREVLLPLALGDEPLLLREPAPESRAAWAPGGSEALEEPEHPAQLRQPIDPSPLHELLSLVAHATSAGAASAETDLYSITPLGWLVLLALLEDPMLGRVFPVAAAQPTPAQDSGLDALARDLAWVPNGGSDSWPWLGAEGLAEVWTHDRATLHLDLLRRVDESRQLQTKAVHGPVPPVQRGSAELGDGELRIVLPEGGTSRLQRWQVSISGLAGEDRNRRPFSTVTTDGRECYHWTVTWQRSAETGRERLVSVTFAQPGLALAGLPDKPEGVRPPGDDSPDHQPTAARPAKEDNKEPGATLENPDELGEPTGSSPLDSTAEPAFALPKCIADAQSKSWSDRGEAHARPPASSGGDQLVRSRLRTALLQWEVDDSYRHPVTELCLHVPDDTLKGRASLRKDPSTWSAAAASAQSEQIPSCAEHRRRAFLDKALEICAALRVDVLVLPEYSVRPETVEWLQKEFGKHDSLRAILAGTYREPTWSVAGEHLPGSALLTLISKEQAAVGMHVARKQRPKVYAATALDELIRPTERELAPLYDNSHSSRTDLLSYLHELVCAENFAATSPANLPALAADMHRRYQRFGIRPLPNESDVFKRVVGTIETLARVLSPDNILRRSVVLVPAMTTRTVDYALLGQTSFLAAGITTVLCSAAVRGWAHAGGSCFIGHDCWNDGESGLPGMPHPGPYHGALPGLWRQAHGGGALGSMEQALLVADIDPVHGADRSPRGQGQAGYPLELVAHIPFVELPPTREPIIEARKAPPCRCERAGKEARDHEREAPGSGLRVRTQALADQVESLLGTHKATTTMDPAVVNGTCKALEALARLIRSSPDLERRLNAFREHHASSLQSWPPPALLDWAVVDPWRGRGAVDIHAPPFSQLSGDGMAKLLSQKGEE